MHFKSDKISSNEPLATPISTTTTLDKRQQKEDKIRKGTEEKNLSVLLKSAFMDVHEEKMRQVKYQNTEAQENVNVGKVSALSVADVSSRSTCVTNCREKFRSPSFSPSSGNFQELLLNWKFPAGIFLLRFENVES